MSPRRRPTSASKPRPGIDRSKWSTSQPPGIDMAANGSANSVHDRPICHPVAPRRCRRRLQQTSYTPMTSPAPV